MYVCMNKYLPQKGGYQMCLNITVFVMFTPLLKEKKKYYYG